MQPELSLIKSFLSYSIWEQHAADITSADMPEELKLLYRTLNSFHETNEAKQDLHILDLASLFFANNPKDKEYYEGVFSTLETYTPNAKAVETLISGIKRSKILRELSIKSYEVAEGKSQYDSLQKLLDSLQQSPKDSNDKQETFVTDNLQDLINDTYKQPGFRWRLKCLNESLGSLRKGDFGFVFARPETGKTTFLASEISFFLSSAIELVSGPIIWFNNEEQGSKVMLRVYQAYFGITLEELYSNIPKYQSLFTEQTKGRFKLLDLASIDRKTVEKVCKKHNPSLIIFDQIDKLKGFDADRKDLVLGAIYQWARELAKTYGPVIGVCQADGTGENVRYLTMGHVADAKCLSPETAVLMYDGTWKAIADVQVNELVMGPDSTPRTVLSTSSGIEEMYKITHKIGGDSYTANKSHILSLIDQRGKYTNKNVLDYSKYDFGYRVGHELDEKVFPIEPYYLGLWLGDGKASAPEVTTMDQEVKDYIKWYSKCWGCTYVEWQNGKANPLLVQSKIKYKQGVKHPLMEALRNLNLENNKHIPDIYFLGSITQRLELIAGLLDTDGTLTKKQHKYFVFSNKDYGIAYGLKCLALSCGLMATFKQKGKYYYVHISGNDLSIIPTKIKRKQSNQKSYKNVLKSRLTIENLGVGPYAGVTLDGDHQYIIEGNIVTHNTAKQAEADWILGIGTIHDTGWESVRFLNISKNKLMGDADSNPKKRHGHMEVLIKPDIARYQNL